ncbi:hypothetical protein EDD39_4736 [Kitasatospora cineracea]|uniref:Uncharacterized protein n=1 Tax=Kitasatospora cineracea TaxID=88074 RepID=A0A8G1ULV7_9ACTN|nr:hypothetical protein EDD39_4736 [Kitasatospora cineracea]
MVAGPAQRGQDGGVEAEGGEDRGGPVAGAGVVQAGGGGVGGLGPEGAGEPVGEQVGDQQQGAGPVEVLLGGELEERVERQVLEAGDAVEVAGGDAAPDVFDGGGAARVAVVEGVVDEGAVGVEESVVDGPAVDADGGDLPAGGGFAQSVEDALVQAEGVPVQAVGELGGGVVEAVGLGELQAVAADAADDDPSAGGAEVRRGEGGRGVGGVGLHGGVSSVVRWWCGEVVRAAKRSTRPAPVAPEPGARRRRRAPPSCPAGDGALSRGAAGAVQGVSAGRLRRRLRRPGRAGRWCG